MIILLLLLYRYVLLMYCVVFSRIADYLSGPLEVDIHVLGNFVLRGEGGVLSVSFSLTLNLLHYHILVDDIDIMLPRDKSFI